MGVSMKQGFVWPLVAALGGCVVGFGFAQQPGGNGEFVDSQGVILRNLTWEEYSPVVYCLDFRCDHCGKTLSRHCLMVGNCKGERIKDGITGLSVRSIAVLLKPTQSPQWTTSRGKVLPDAMWVLQEPSDEIVGGDPNPDFPGNMTVKDYLHSLDRRFQRLPN